MLCCSRSLSPHRGVDFECCDPLHGGLNVSTNNCSRSTLVLDVAQNGADITSKKIDHVFYIRDFAPRVQTSTVVKSMAARTFQCDFRNVAQLPVRWRSGAGSMPCCFQYMPDSRVRDVIAHVCQRTLNAVVAPRWVVLRESKDQVNDHLTKLRALFNGCFGTEVVAS